MAEKKGKKRWFFIGALVAAVAAFFAIFRRRNRGLEESEWQELPPPEGS